MSSKPSSMDARLLARMTGRLGDAKTVEAILSALGDAIGDDLRDRLRKITGLPLETSDCVVDQGTCSQMALHFDEDHTLCETAIAGWCDDLILGIDNTLAIACTEQLLGGTFADEVAVRSLSDIERDVAAMIAEQVALALREAVASGDGEPRCAAPFEGPLKREQDFLDTAFSATLSIDYQVSDTRFRIRLMAPQAVVLKTVLARAPAETASSQTENWKDRLTRSIRSSNVLLQATVDLEEMSLAQLGALRAGDTLPFRDTTDVRVLLKANGKELYWCEMGRAGQRYMLQVRDRYGSEQDLLRQLAT